MRRITLGLLAAWIMVALANVALGSNVAITIAMPEVGVRNDARGQTYIVKFDLPADLAGKRLDSVFLDFVVDTSPTSEAEAEATPLIGVFPLTVAATGPTLIYESEVSSVRPVSMGDGQKVRADITEIVRVWLASPASNHGLVIGTLTGPDVGTMMLKDSALGPGTALRVTFFYQNRFGGHVPTN